MTKHKRGSIGVCAIIVVLTLAYLSGFSVGSFSNKAIAKKIRTAELKSSAIEMTPEEFISLTGTRHAFVDLILIEDNRIWGVLRQKLPARPGMTPPYLVFMSMDSRSKEFWIDRIMRMKTPEIKLKVDEWDSLGLE